MQVTILYPTHSPLEREAEVLAKRLSDFRIEPRMVNSESREYDAMRETYSILGSPAIFLTRDDGSMVESWQNSWPLAEDISYLYHM